MFTSLRRGKHRIRLAAERSRRLGCSPNPLLRPKILADTSTTPLGVTDLEAWHRKQKQITERRLWEEEEMRELAKNWMKQDAYVKASLPKKIWMCLQYIYWDIRGEKHMPEIPAHLRMEMARCLLPDIIAFCESEKGKAEIAQWKAEQATKKEQSKAS